MAGGGGSALAPVFAGVGNGQQETSEEGEVVPLYAFPPPFYPAAFKPPSSKTKGGVQESKEERALAAAMVAAAAQVAGSEAVSAWFGAELGATGRPWGIAGGSAVGAAPPQPGSSQQQQGQRQQGQGLGLGRAAPQLVAVAPSVLLMRQAAALIQGIQVELQVGGWVLGGWAARDCRVQRSS